VFYAPERREVAEFLRAGNLLPAEVLAAGGGRVTIGIAGRVLTAVSSLAPGRRALACVHPEEVRIERAGDAAGEGLTATVVAVTDRGPTLRLDLDCGFPLRALVTRRSARELALRAGDQVVVALAPESVHLIPEDGELSTAPEIRSGRK
jgi:ABC-type Fe3+/spermidine/putrescine transport system ATPase subunit